MNAERRHLQVQAAVRDLQERIRARFPSAQFALAQGAGDDPEGLYLVTTVDVDDPDEVLDVVMDRLLNYEDVQGLPLYVLPIRTFERIAADMAAWTPRERPVSSLW